MAKPEEEKIEDEDLDVNEDLDLGGDLGGEDLDLGGEAGGEAPPQKPVKLTPKEPKVDKIKKLEPKQNILSRFLRMFKIGVDPEQPERNKSIYPLTKTTDEFGIHSIKKDVFPEDVQKLYKYWLDDCHDSVDSWKDRMKLWEDMDTIYYNDPIVNIAIETVADEVIQADTHEQPIMIEAEEKQKQFLLDFFDKIGLYIKLRPIVTSIVQYGNAGTIVGLDESGVSDLILIDIKELTERMEFTPYKVQKAINGGDEFMNRYRNKVKRIDQLIKSIQNTENILSYYKKYLFGFQIGDMVLPPWRFLHFRNTTSKSPFEPYGIPMFIGSIATYRQYDAAMTMQVVARGARFPKHVYKLSLPNVINPTEKVAMAVEMINQLQNSGLLGVRKEEPGVGETIVTIDGLYVYEQETPEIDVGKIDDIELLRDDRMISTRLPRYMLDTKDSGFGDSGVSVAEKWKPFARFVYRGQQALLEQITQLCKIHMIQSRRFKEDEIDFILSMHYPESMTNSTLIDNQDSLIELASNIIQTLQDKFNAGEPLPDELIKDIYTKFLPYDDVTFNKWFDLIDQVQKQQELEAEKETETEVDVSKKAESLQKLIHNEDKYRKRVAGPNWRLLEKKYKTVNLKEQVSKIVLKEKQKTLREGIMKRKHYYSSKNVDDKFNPSILLKLDKEILKEDFDNKEEIKKLMEGNEVLEYVFKGKKRRKKKERKNVKKKDS